MNIKINTGKTDWAWATYDSLLSNKEMNVQVVEWPNGEGISILRADETEIQMDWDEWHAVSKCVKSLDNPQAVGNISSMDSTKVSSVNLTVAILMQVKEFADSAQEFTQDDVFVAIERKCNDGLLDVPEIKEGEGYNIWKSNARSIFEELYSTCFIEGIPALNAEPDEDSGEVVFSANN